MTCLSLIFSSQSSPNPEILRQPSDPRLAWSDSLSLTEGAVGYKMKARGVFLRKRQPSSKGNNGVGSVAQQWSIRPALTGPWFQCTVLQKTAGTPVHHPGVSTDLLEPEQDQPLPQPFLASTLVCSISSAPPESLGILLEYNFLWFLIPITSSLS